MSQARSFTASHLNLGVRLMLLENFFHVVAFGELLQYLFKHKWDLSGDQSVHLKY